MELLDTFFLFLQRNERLLGIAAGTIIIIAQLSYLISTLKREVRPNILSWYGWAALMGTSFISQLINGWQWSLTGLMLSTAGSIVIATTALFYRNFFFERKDWNFVFASLVCIALYFMSKNALYTTVFAVLADLLLGIPTIKNAYKNPKAEKSLAWIFGLASWTIALPVCINHDLLYALFPIYLFLFNATMVFLTMNFRIS